MTFSGALNKAKAVDKAEKAREGATAAHAQVAAFQPRNAQEDDEDDEAEVVELLVRMPRSFDFGLTDHSAGGMRETWGAATVDPHGSLFSLYMWSVQILP